MKVRWRCVPRNAAGTVAGLHPADARSLKNSLWNRVCTCISTIEGCLIFLQIPSRSHVACVLHKHAAQVASLILRRSWMTPALQSSMCTYCIMPGASNDFPANPTLQQLAHVHLCNRNSLSVLDSINYPIAGRSAPIHRQMS